MNVFKLLGWWKAYRHPINERLVIDDKRGSGYVLKGDKLTLERYESTVRYGLLKFQNIIYEPQTTRFGDAYLMEQIQQGNVRLLDEEGNKQDLSDIVVYILVSEASSKQDDVLVSFIYDYPDDGDDSIIVLDTQTGEFRLKATPRHTLFFTVDSELYSEYAFFDGEISRLDHSFNKIWSYKYDGDRPTIVRSRSLASFPNHIVFNLTAIPKQGIEGLATEGQLCALNKADGSVKWKCTFDYQVDDLCRVGGDDSIVLFSADELILLNGESGDIIQIIHTGLDKQTGTVFIQVLGAYLFLFCRKGPTQAKGNLMQVYDTSTWECVRQVQGEELGGVFYQLPQTVDDKVFVPIETRFGSSMLVIDINDIQSPIEFEQEPEFIISTPDENNRAIVMEVNYPELGDVLRLAEIQGLKHAEEQGDEGRGLGSSQHFDGRVILKYSGCTADRREAIEKLDMLKERFDFYAKEDTFICRSGDGKRYATLEYELL